MAGPPSDADAAQLARILTSALAQNNAERQQAEAALASLTSREGYCLGLLAVLQAQGVPLSTKWLAAVQLKNNVTARWGVQPRGSQSAALTEGEKHHVREAALRLVGLPDAQLAVHLAVVVAKAARHDYPARWPALFERLCAPLAQRTAGRLEARRIWLTLHHVYKELASKRLPLDRRRFRDITARDLPLVWAAWRECAAAVAGNVAAALAGDAAAAAAVAEAFEAWMLQTKVLRRLLMAGVPRCAPADAQRAAHSAQPPRCATTRALRAGMWRRWRPTRGSAARCPRRPPRWRACWRTGRRTRRRACAPPPCSTRRCSSSSSSTSASSRTTPGRCTTRARWARAWRRRAAW